jgi:hypothetical protein
LQNIQQQVHINGTHVLVVQETDIAYSSAIDVSNSLCIVGQYGSTLTFYDANGVAYGSQLTTIGGADGFMAKYNATGAIQFVSKLGGAGTDYGVSITTDRDNNQYLLANAGTNVGLYNSNMYYAIPSPVDSLSTVGKDSLKAMYATRKVRSAYTGPLFKIRRSSDNVELDFYSDMFGVYTQNADGTGQTLTAWLNGATAFIRTWYDQSKYGNHATQTVTASQPIFDLTNKYINFKTNRYFALPDGTVPGNNSKYTITYKHNTIPVQSSFSPVLYSGNFTSNQAIILALVNVASGGVLYYRDDWRASSTEFTGYAVGNTFTATYNQSNSISYLNGVIVSNNGINNNVAKSNQTNPSTNNYIGYIPASNFPYMNGEIYYLSIFDNVLSSTDRLTVENNIIQTSTIPVNSSLASTLANANSYSILAKYNSEGGLLWSNIIAADFSSLRSKYVLVDDTYNIYIAGGATATSIVDSAGNTTYTLPNAGSTDAVLLKYRQSNSSTTDYQQGYTYQNTIFDASAQYYNTALTFTNTYNTAQPLKQLSYNAGRLVLYETLQNAYYNGYNDAMQNKHLLHYYTTHLHKHN